MLQEEYQVSLDAFRGPLDLLLYLIRRAEVDVHDIPIHLITEQYLDFVRGLDDIDIELAGEFLVMAATLIEIKSRSLSPAPTEEQEAVEGSSTEDGPAADPRLELIQQLLAYQRYRAASELLDDRRLEFQDRFPGRPAKPPRDEGADAEDEIELDLDDIHILDLHAAYERLASSIDFARLGDHRVEVDDTPIALHQADLMDRLQRTPTQRMTLQESFDGKSVGQRVGLFMAMLELTRMRKILVRQDEVDDEIEIQANPDAPEGDVIEADAPPPPVVMTARDLKDGSDADSPADPTLGSSSDPASDPSSDSPTDPPMTK